MLPEPWMGSNEPSSDQSSMPEPRPARPLRRTPHRKARRRKQRSPRKAPTDRSPRTPCRSMPIHAECSSPWQLQSHASEQRRSFARSSWCRAGSAARATTMASGSDQGSVRFRTVLGPDRPPFHRHWREQMRGGKGAPALRRDQRACAELVAGRIAEIGQVHLAGADLTNARRVFD